MGGKKSKAPAAPDYAGLAQQDAESQRDTAQYLTQANRPNQVDTYGNSINWSQDANGNWTQSQTLNPYFQAGQSQALGSYLNASQAVANQGGFNAPTMDYAYYNFNNAAGQPAFANNAGAIGSFTDDPTQLGYFNGSQTSGPIGNFDRTQGDQVAHDMYESSMSRLRPDQARTQEALDVKLRQQGLQPGTEAYNRAMQNEMTSQGDVNAKLALDSTGAGYQAAQGIYNTNLGGQQQRYAQQLGDFGANQAKEQQLYEQALGAYGANLAGQNQRFSQSKDVYDTNNEQAWKTAQFGSQIQQQNYNQALQNYSLPMERAQAAAQLYSQAPQPNFPGFSGATGYNPADMTGAANASYQAKMGGYNAGQNKKNGMMSTGGTLGAAMIMSDKTLKENIVPISGADALGALLHLGGYEYDWKDGSGHDMGTIAQDVAKVLPDLVELAATGKLCVNYTALFAIAVEAIKYLAEQHHGYV